MAYEETVKSITLLSGADFSTTGQYRFGVIGSDGKIELASSGGRAEGVIYDNPAEDRECVLAIGGVLMVEYGGAITAGGDVMSGANGVGVAATGTNMVLGTALETGVSGDIRPVLFQPTGMLA